MKSSLLCLFLASAFLFAEEPEMKIPEYTQIQKPVRNYDVMLFGQLDAYVPFGGVATRFHGNQLSGELAASGFGIPNVYSVKTSASMLHYFSPKEEVKGFYLGGGLGYIGAQYEGSFQSDLFVPIFFGLQGKKMFFDFGVDMIGHKEFIPVPTFRTGVCF